MERNPWTRWFRPRSQDPCRGVELLFYGCRSKGDVLWRPWNGQDQERLAPDSRESETSQLQLRSEEHTSELQSHSDLVCRLLLEKKKKKKKQKNQNVHTYSNTTKTLEIQLM